jgi:hypothetical protein
VTHYAEQVEDSRSIEGAVSPGKRRSWDVTGACRSLFVRARSRTSGHIRRAWQVMGWSPWVPSFGGCAVRGEGPVRVFRMIERDRGAGPRSVSGCGLAGQGHVDDDLAEGMALLHDGQGFGCLRQGVGLADMGVETFLHHECGRAFQVGSVEVATHPLAAEFGHRVPRRCSARALAPAASRRA